MYVCCGGLQLIDTGFSGMCFFVFCFLTFVIILGLGMVGLRNMNPQYARCLPCGV